MSEAVPRPSASRTFGLYRIAPTPTADGLVAYAGARPVARVEVADPNSARTALERELGRRGRRLRGQRADGVATTEEFQDLLDSLPTTWRAKILRLLEAHLTLGGRATAAEIGRRAGKDVTHVWWAYQRFGRKVASALGARPREPAPLPLDHVRAILTFARAERDSAMDDWTLVLRPELTAALSQMTAGPPHETPAPTTEKGPDA